MALSRRTGLLSLLGVLGAGVAGCTGSPAPTPAASETPTPSATDTIPAVPDPLPAGLVTALICGTDSTADNTNTDVLVVAQLSADRSHLTLVSIPRDSYVTIDGGPAKNKVNSALSTGGIDGLKRTVSDLLGGLAITYVAQTNFADFTTLATIFDGFSVTNKVASSVTSTVTGKVTKFPAGTLEVHGAEWLIYVRQRHELPNSDFDREERHRAVITGLLKRAQALLTSPAQFTKAVRDATRCVRLHGGLTADNLLGLVAALRAVRAGNVTSLRLLDSGSGNVGNVLDAVFLDTAALAQLAAGLRQGDVSGYLKTHSAG